MVADVVHARGKRSPDSRGSARAGFAPSSERYLDAGTCVARKMAGWRGSHSALRTSRSQELAKRSLSEQGPRTRP